MHRQSLIEELRTELALMRARSNRDKVYDERDPESTCITESMSVA